MELLEDNISKLPFLQLIGSYDNAIEAMKGIQGQKVDLIFLDIQMPKLSGFEALKKLELKEIPAFAGMSYEFTGLLFFSI